jgi:hypothetical protein
VDGIKLQTMIGVNGITIAQRSVNVSEGHATTGIIKTIAKTLAVTGVLNVVVIRLINGVKPNALMLVQIVDTIANRILAGQLVTKIPTAFAQPIIAIMISKYFTTIQLMVIVYLTARVILEPRERNPVHLS